MIMWLEKKTRTHFYISLKVCCADQKSLCLLMSVGTIHVHAKRIYCACQWDKVFIVHGCNLFQLWTITITGRIAYSESWSSCFKMSKFGMCSHLQLAKKAMSYPRARFTSCPRYCWTCPCLALYACAEGCAGHNVFPHTRLTSIYCLHCCECCTALQSSHCSK